MTASDRQSHWQTVYLTKGEQQVSWSQADPQPSLRLIESVAAGHDAAIVDVGGGASRLVDALLANGFHDVAVLDLSDAALANARQRIGAASDAVRWIAGDVTVWQPRQAFDVWHDRAAFHFLVEEDDRAVQLACARQATCARFRAANHLDLVRTLLVFGHRTRIVLARREWAEGVVIAGLSLN